MPGWRDGQTYWWIRCEGPGEKSMVILKHMGYVTVTDGARDIGEWARLFLYRDQELNLGNVSLRYVLDV